ncbi:peptidase M1 [Flavobacterium album]|uniref:Peptidase M1 n=1 Tax=Flavobacterium album TaxID=2175091 RepID=A0A2S1R1G6_9FLAO|nr:M1 family metallopeptidase [Flavobacterium album]AWH86485.1 peptidase M1 [Flavobacterium album]
MKKVLLLAIVFFGIYSATAQTYTRRDSLQGGLRRERTSFDVQRYDLNITLDPDKKYISGYNDISFDIVETTNRIQLDLFENMKVDSIVWSGKKMPFRRDNDAVFISFPSPIKISKGHKIRFYYSGYPLVAKNAPWDGGFVFSKDTAGKPWIGVAVQGTGASLWFPVKDHQTDEPDKGASVKVAVPNGLMDVSNGRFMGSTDLKNGYTRWDWEVKNPINNYTITLNVADYAHIHDNLRGLDLDYYVLKQNEEKAKEHFEEVKPMLECFQSKFGQYPFFEDGYKLVETPYLGMEHQSAVAYGNKYKKGYMGSDMSGTSVGMLFDYITVHESGHEWFGNSITSKDIADMWIHEGFTTYSETVFVECLYGYDKAMKYITGQQMAVSNNKPVIGVFGVNKEGSGDMYFKGALMLNTLRHVVNDDDKWWKMLLKYSETYKKKVIDTETVVAFFNKETGMNLTPFFNQYLRYKNPPILQLKLNNGKLEYRWQTDEANFKLPVAIVANGKEVRLYGTNDWKISDVDVADLKDVALQKTKFYVKVQKL